MKIEKHDTDSQEAVITVTIEPKDYEEKFQDNLSTYRKKTDLKGFRKGKTPMGYIRKLYGKAILADVVNEVLQKAVTGYLGEEKIDFLGQPLPSEDQQPIDFEVNRPGNFEFKFDLGLAPEFDLKGIDKGKFKRDKVTIPDKMVRDELDLGRRRHGEQISAESDIREDDVLTINAKELENGQLKEGGHETGFSVMVSKIDDTTLRNDILKMQTGDSFQFDIFKLEGDKEKAYVRKYLLNLKEEEKDKEINPEFEGTIKEVTRVAFANMDQSFFDRFFGEDKVHNEEEALDAIRVDIAKHYEKQADAMLYKSIQQEIMDKHDLALPDDFLKRWLLSGNEDLSEKEIEENYSDFRQNLKWRLIKNKISKKFDIKVEEQDIKQQALQRIINYVGAYQDEALVKSLMQRILSDRDQVERIAEEIEANKIFEALKGQYTITDVPVSLDEFRDKVKEASPEQA